MLDQPDPQPSPIFPPSGATAWTQQRRDRRSQKRPCRRSHAIPSPTLSAAEAAARTSSAAPGASSPCPSVAHTHAARGEAGSAARSDRKRRSTSGPSTIGTAPWPPPSPASRSRVRRGPAAREPLRRCFRRADGCASGSGGRSAVAMASRRRGGGSALAPTRWRRQRSCR